MTQASTFGRSLGQVLHLKDAPSSLITRSMRGLELAFTESRNDNPAPGLSGSFIPEDAFLVSLKFHDYPDCELWGDGKCVAKADVPAGATYLYDLKHDPRYVINKPFHNLFFYMPRSALDGLTEQSAHAARRPARLSISASAMTMRSSAMSARSLQEGLRRPHETNQLFIDHMMLALTAHVAQTYGGLQQIAKSARGGLAPWQMKQACERLKSDLGGKLSLATNRG